MIMVAKLSCRKLPVSWHEELSVISRNQCVLEGESALDLYDLVLVLISISHRRLNFVSKKEIMFVVDQQSWGNFNDSKTFTHKTRGFATKHRYAAKSLYHRESFFRIFFHDQNSFGRICSCGLFYNSFRSF